MTSPPAKLSGVRLCITVTKEGVTAYGNRQAFKAMADWMTWLANSHDAEHFECHVVMALEDDQSKFDGKESRNVWVLLDKNLTDSFEKRSEENTGFELTFMVVEKSDLDYMERFQKLGVLPDDWNKNH
jgi:hypothetical protein